MTQMMMLRTIATLSAALVLSGCGFQPMYGQSQTATVFRAVDVDVPGHDRVDQLLAETLRDQFGAPSGSQRYRLVAQTEISVSGLGVGADDIATRMALRMTVRFELYDGTASAPVLSEQVRAEASFDLPAQPYAAESARRDAEERAARDAAQRIAARIARHVRRADSR